MSPLYPASRLDEEKEKNGGILDELEELKAYVERVNLKEKKWRDEMEKRSAVLEDLIANSQMLPDLMLASTK